MQMIAIGDVYRMDVQGNILDPAGNVIAERGQQLMTGVIAVSVDMLNQIYQHGRTASAIDRAGRSANTTSRIEVAKATIDADGPIGRLEKWAFERIEICRAMEKHHASLDSQRVAAHSERRTLETMLLVLHETPHVG